MEFNNKINDNDWFEDDNDNKFNNNNELLLNKNNFNNKKENEEEKSKGTDIMMEEEIREDEIRGEEIEKDMTEEEIRENEIEMEERIRKEKSKRNDMMMEGEHELFYDNNKIINIYIRYYKKRYCDKYINNMFEEREIDNNERENIKGTFYKEIQEYNELYKRDKERSKIYKREDIEIEEDMYGLYIEGEIEYISYIIFPLILCIIDKDIRREWEIKKIKRNI